MTERILVLALFAVGVWAVVARRNLVKKVFGLAIANSAVVILFILEGERIGSMAPVMVEGTRSVVDPVPQALMLTAIVIGVCVTALALALVSRLYQKAKTLDIDEIRERLDHDAE